MNNIIYLVGPQQTFPRVVSECVNDFHVTKITFTRCETVVFKVMFASLRCEDAMNRICEKCPMTRVVCARRPIFVGLTLTASIVWSVEIDRSPDVLFSNKNSVPGEWHADVPQPNFDTIHVDTFYTKKQIQGCAVHVETDAEGRVRIDNGCMVSPTGKYPVETEIQTETDMRFGAHPAPLQVGEHIAYLLPMVPVEKQARFIVTKIIGVHPKRKCCVDLENGHHTNIVASGNVHVARYCMLTHRVQFPVRHLSMFVTSPY